MSPSATICAASFGIDHRGAAGHRQHEVRQQRTQREVGRPGRRRHHDALRPADQVVVLDRATVGVELLAGDQGHRVQATLRVGELDALALGQQVAGPPSSARLDRGRRPDRWPRRSRPAIRRVHDEVLAGRASPGSPAIELVRSAAYRAGPCRARARGPRRRSASRPGVRSAPRVPATPRRCMRPVGRVDDDDAPAAGLAGPPQRLGQRHVGVDEDAGTQQLREPHPAQAFGTAATRRDWLAPVQMNAASNTPSPPRRSVAPAATATLPTATSTAMTRPAQAATRVRCAGAARAQVEGPQHPAAVERQPGQQVEHRHDQIAPVSSSSNARRRAVRVKARALQRRRRPASRADTDGSGHGDEQLVAGPLDLALDLGDAAEEEDHDAPDRLAQGQADGGVAEFVGEHAQPRARPRSRTRPGRTPPTPMPSTQFADDRAVQDGDQRRDEQPGRREVERHAEEAPDPQQGRARAAGARGRLHARDGTGRARRAGYRCAIMRTSAPSTGEPRGSCGDRRPTVRGTGPARSSADGVARPTAHQLADAAQLAAARGPGRGATARPPVAASGRGGRPRTLAVGSRASWS